MNFSLHEKKENQDKHKPKYGHKCFGIAYVAHEGIEHLQASGNSGSKADRWGNQSDTIWYRDIADIGVVASLNSFKLVSADNSAKCRISLRLS